MRPCSNYRVERVECAFVIGDGNIGKTSNSIFRKNEEI